MAGKAESGGNSGAGPTTKPKVTTFNCGHCGAPVSVRYPGHSLSAVCDSCHSIIDTTDETFRVLHEYDRRKDFEPRIELGTRGVLFGKTWECIGFVVRTDRASGFSWEEYLLFNPYYGYRWLTCNNSHWNFVTTIKEKPDGSGVNPRFDRNPCDPKSNPKEYKRYYHGIAFVSYVFGEFYWKVKVGEEVTMEDYICPPEMLSCENDVGQRVWSISDYIEPSMVKEAFQLPDGSLDKPFGVAPNQPSKATEDWKKISKLWFVFFIVLTSLFCAHVMQATNVTAFEKSIPYTTKPEGSSAPSNESTTTEPFTLTKNNTNVEISIIGNSVDNSWLYVYGELVNEDTDETFSFEKTIEYYHGYESGESWSEGSNNAKVLISQVPGGKYYLNLDYDNGGSTSQQRATFYVGVVRDVPTYLNYVLGLLMLSFLPIWVGLQSYGFEVARWKDSDYSPYQSYES